MRSASEGRTLQLPGLQYTSAVNQALRIWHPFTHSKLDLPSLQVERGEGVYLCTKDGKKILDAISSWWVNLYGHANPRIAAAIAEQACRLEHVILAGFTHDAAKELARRVAAAAGKCGLCFTAVGDGAEGVASCVRRDCGGGGGVVLRVACVLH